MYKTITIRKSFDFRNNRKVQFHSSKADDVKILSEKEMKVTVCDDETIWFSLYWWRTRCYTYNDFENERIYILRPTILDYRLAIIFTLFVFIVVFMCRYNPSYIWLAYVLLAVSVIVLAVNVFMRSKMMRLESFEKD